MLSLSPVGDSTYFLDVGNAEDSIYGRDGYDFDGYRLRVELTHGGRGISSSADRYSSLRVARRSDHRVMVTGLPPSASWQDLKDHMRRAGDVCFSQVYRDRGGMMGIVDYTNYDDMKYAIRKLDDSQFRNAFSRSYIRVGEYDSRRPSYDSSRSYSKSPSRSPYRSRSRSPSQGRSYRRHSRSISPRGSKYSHRSPSLSHSRSLSKSRSPISLARRRSRSRSRSRSASVSNSPSARSVWHGSVGSKEDRY